MAEIQRFAAQWSEERVREWAFANPTAPRVIGIDVGQDKLTVWFGAPQTQHKATRADNLRFCYFSWLLCRCPSTRTNAEACRLVVAALDVYRVHPFSLASDIVIEKQHKRNGRMRALAKEIRAWIRRRVPGSQRMRIVERQALSKFANIVQMPCPMPREYTARKQAAERVVAAQVRNWAGDQWFRFYTAHPTCADDLADAALIAQDYTLAVYPMEMIADQALRSVLRLLSQRRARNTWRKKRTSIGKYRSEYERDYYDDDADAEQEQSRKRAHDYDEISDDSDGDDVDQADRREHNRQRTDYAVTLSGRDQCELMALHEVATESWGPK